MSKRIDTSKAPPIWERCVTIVCSPGTLETRETPAVPPTLMRTGLLKAMHRAMHEYRRNTKVTGLRNSIVDHLKVIFVGQAEIIDDHIVAIREAFPLEGLDRVGLTLAHQGDLNICVSVKTLA